MSDGLEGRTVIVTGAAGQLGTAFSLAFAAAGARVVSVDLDVAAVEGVAEEVRSRGGEGLAVAADVADEDSVRAMAEAALAAFGSIDVLVNNAAIYAGISMLSFEDIDVREWDRVMAVNARGPWLCLKACADALREGGGSVINISSAVVMSGTPLFAHYVASKSALIGLSRALARELGGDGVRVNVIAPGFTLTRASRDLIPDAESFAVDRGAIKRNLEADDLVGTALFLASDASAMITGQTFLVDGGREFI
jgi:NAD(P)-dependent dehydrogenase (short-subunit alcohol dehydrogenase family)